MSYPQNAKSSTGRSETVQPVAVVADIAALPAGTNRSGSITTGGSSQVLAAALPNRRWLRGQNVSAGDLWINESGSAASAGQPSYKVPPQGTFQVSTNRQITIFGATTGQQFSATEA